MTKEDKLSIINELSEKFKETSHFYVTDTSGLTVAEINDFRRKCFEKGIEYRVVKNTLIKKALDNLDADFTSFYDEGVLKGFSGIMFSDENANSPAKILKEYKKKDKDKNPSLKAASIDYDLFIGADQLETLSSLKSKQELIGEVIGLLQSPVSNVMGSLMSGQHKLAGIVKTLQERS
jgi:large subunit ribosomal protein L10